ncbi:hypothetical protein BK128_09495 [Viridibacillus sp. FSL H7-0596]|uniref:BRO-N domain-containing protein n=1 Tax=Viridibacillus sp. FSL H7-0596 TaxID=1928923 RepID=UPI00096D5A59|nr:BRO family protein [Viridibacillus sp. FSL H7-0596]OMC86889.1 hypothetical protein BK128_09495 [Viridibacillus sp. FSL H7-0596]
MNQLKTFRNNFFEVGTKVQNETILFDVEQVAKCLGITQQKNGIDYVRWERVNEYLPKNSPHVGKGDLIPEPLVYKLAFKASNEVAEQFQDWLAIEVIPSIRETGSYQMDRTQLSPQLQMFGVMFESQAKIELKQKEQERIQQKQAQRIEQVEKKQENINQILSLNPVQWRSKVTTILNRIGQARGGFEEYRNVRNESYKVLEQRGRCKLEIRVTNRKKEMSLNGVPKSKVSKVSKIDVIAEDTRLTEIYLAIVKEMAIKYQVNAEGLGA